QDSHSHFCMVVVVMPVKGTLGRVNVDRPGPGEELNAGEPTVPRQAATVIVLRGGDSRLEALLVKRNPASRFMGGAWVFPGGAGRRDRGGRPDRHAGRARVRGMSTEMPLTVAVTGPTGDIGRALLRALERDTRVGTVLGMARREFDPAKMGLRKTRYRRGDV